MSNTVPGAKGVLPPAAQIRLARMADHPLILELDSTDLEQALREGTAKSNGRNGAGRMESGLGDLVLGNSNVNQARVSPKLVMSDAGRRHLVAQRGDRLDLNIEEAVGRHAKRNASKPGRIGEAITFSLDKHVASIILPEKQKAAFIANYAKKVEAGRASATINGEPFRAYLERMIDTDVNAVTKLEVRICEAQVPGFKKLPAYAKGPAATLLAHMAENMPENLPIEVRRQAAFARMQQHTMPWEHVRQLLQGDAIPAGSVAITHGTGNGKMLALTGFRGDPSQLWEWYEQNVPKEWRNALGIKKPGGAAIYGPGIYAGTADSVGPGYAHQKYDPHNNRPAQVIEGILSPGKITDQRLDKDLLADTYRTIGTGNDPIVVVRPNGGARIHTRGYTEIGRKTNLDALVPAVLEGHRFNAEWALEQLDGESPTKVRQALERHLEKPDAKMRELALDLLARAETKEAEAIAAAAKPTTGIRALGEVMLAGLKKKLHAS